MNSPDGRRNNCKTCRNEYDRAKKCPQCEDTKPLSAFSKDKRTPDGRQSWCKVCTSVRGKERYNTEAGAGTLLMRKYGITLAEYDRMVEEQDGRCAICGTTEPGKDLSRFCVDHNHVTGEVRGLLCNSCNRGIGLLQDNLGVVLSAAKYLEKFV